MAKDIKLIFDATYMSGDFELNTGDLVREEGLETAVMISLFTDRRVNEYENPDNVKDKRGWWGDLLSEIEEDQIGSKLWLLERETLSSETVERAKIYALEALEWLVEDGVAQNVDVIAEKQGRERLALEVKIYKYDDTMETFKYDDVWEAQFS